MTLTHSLTHSLYSLHGAGHFFEKMIVIQLVKRYPAFFMEPEGSLP
jgi:hypothetical protein